MTLSSIGSTRGFDQLFPYQPSVVKENRLYQIELIKHDDIEYTFNYRPTKPVKSVNLALCSNKWIPDITMKEKNGSYSVKQLLTRETHYYKFVLVHLDNSTEWVCDKAQTTYTEPSGNINNVLYLSNYNDLKMLRTEFNKMRQVCENKTNQYYLHRDRDLIVIFRLFEEADSEFNGYAMICRTGYENNVKAEKYHVELPGSILEFVVGARMHIPNYDINIVRSDAFLRGVTGNLENYKDISWLKRIANISQLY
jgi:hypothetical protein